MALRDIFRTKTVPCRAVVEVNSDAIRILVFETRMSPAAPGILIPVVTKKLVFSIAPTSRSPLRIAITLRESLFTMVKELGKVPERITIAVGQDMAQESLDSWTVRMSALAQRVSGHDLDMYFKNLILEQPQDGSVILAYPIDVIINGYSLRAMPVRSDPRKRGALVENISLPAGTRDITFRVVRSVFAPEVGTVLAEARRGLGGMPIEFVPTPVAATEATCHETDSRQMLAVDIGRFRTTIVFVSECMVRGIVSFTHGYEEWVAALGARYQGDAENLLRQYAMGITSAGEQSLCKSVLSQAVEAWSREFMKAVEAFYPLGPLPADIRLYGIGASVPEVNASFRDAAMVSDLSVSTVLTVRALTAESIFSGATFGGIVSGPAEVGIASVLYFSLYHQPIF